MGNEEAVTPSKSDKALSPVLEQPVTHPYLDWAAMQAYYGHAVSMPPPYFNTAVAPGHPPHPYMWAPQPLMPPFATAYPAVYPHGVYAHPLMVSPATTDVPAKSSNSKDKGLIKKLKGFDGLAVSIGNVSAEIKVGDESGQSLSGENGTEGSRDASDENNESGGKENRRKRSSEDTPSSGDKKSGALARDYYGGEPNGTTIAPKGVIVPAPNITCKPVCSVPLSSQSPGMEFMATNLPWAQDERELKRERRKQSNRESARRSRLRKQAETEELAKQVDALGEENTSLRSEISQLNENLEKLRSGNSLLLEKVKSADDNSLYKLESQEVPSVVVENFLSRIDEVRRDENPVNSNSNSNSHGGKLHQLLDPSPRTDAMVAG